MTAKYRVEQGHIYEFQAEENGPGSYVHCGTMLGCKNLEEWLLKKYQKELKKYPLSDWGGS